MTFAFDDRTARVNELYGQVRELNAFKLFDYCYGVLNEQERKAPRDSARSIPRRELIGKFYDQLFHKAPRRIFNFSDSVEDYMQRALGACRVGLGAVAEAIDRFGVQIPEDGKLEGAYVPAGHQ